jgi:hypothetical protein
MDRVARPLIRRVGEHAQLLDPCAVRCRGTGTGPGCPVVMCWCWVQTATRIAARTNA